MDIVKIEAVSKELQPLRFGKYGIRESIKKGGRVSIQDILKLKGLEKYNPDYGALLAIEKLLDQESTGRYMN